MTELEVQAAADVLWNEWRSGGRIAALPESLRPVTRADGYAIQATLDQRTAFPLFGWKIAATSPAGQKHIGVDGPLAGRLLRERAVASGETVAFGTHEDMRVAEAEFAFRMRVDLPPRTIDYSLEEVIDAVDTVHPAIELPDSRYHRFTTVGAAQLIADNACAHHFVLGPPTLVDWRPIDLAQHRVVGMVHRGSPDATGTPSVTHEGSGANVLGDPRIALTWLANELSHLGLTLAAGQVVTTGTCVVPLPISPGDHVVMDFGELGKVDARLR